MKIKPDKYDVRIFLAIIIVLFTPVFAGFYTFLNNGNPYGGFGVLTVNESMFDGAIMSFLFFFTIYLFTFEVKKKYLIIGITLAVLLLPSLLLGVLDYSLFIEAFEYFLFYFCFSLTGFILAKLFLFVKNKYANG